MKQMKMLGEQLCPREVQHEFVSPQYETVHSLNALQMFLGSNSTSFVHVLECSPSSLLRSIEDLN